LKDKTNIKNHRIGETNKNIFGQKIIIIEYINARDITAQFEDGFKVQTTYQLFNKGYVKNPNYRSVYNVGYFGIGKYKAKINSKDTPEYKTWLAMMGRCYNLHTHSKNPTYIDCTVCEEWHNFQNFAKWYEDNYYEIEGELMCLDKDILIKGNRIYSPDNCVFVPKNINLLFTKSNIVRGDYPIGVDFVKTSNKYRARCLDGFGKSIYLGLYLNPFDAFIAYKKHKEKTIKSIAKLYEDKIPKKLYFALYNYIVEITD